MKIKKVEIKRPVKVRESKPEATPQRRFVSTLRRDTE
jgi:hypothetical protein